MTEVVRGSSIVLSAEFREFAPDGPLTDVDNITITVVPLLGGVPALPVTSAGISNPAVGIYGFEWNVSAVLDPGEYVAIWSGNDVNTGDVVQATEQVTVLSATPTGPAAKAIGSIPCPGSWEPNFCGCDLPDASANPDLDIDAIIAAQTAAAAEILYNLSGQRFGLCEVVTRPCRRECFGSSWPYADRFWEWTGGSWPRPILYDGAWFNTVCGSCPGSCSCGPLSEVLLPGPVYDVVSVVIDGVPLVKDVDYRVDDHRKLLRLGGQQWPVCQDMTAANDAVGAWTVTVAFGEPLWESGKLALGELACEFIKACIPGADCSLPQPMQRLVRQGIDMAFLDPNELFGAGRIGFYRTDLFLATANPRRLPGRPQVYDVDGGSFRRPGT